MKELTIDEKIIFKIYQMFGIIYYDESKSCWRFSYFVFLFIIKYVSQLFYTYTMFYHGFYQNNLINKLPLALQWMTWITITFHFTFITAKNNKKILNLFKEFYMVQMDCKTSHRKLYRTKMLFYFLLVFYSILRGITDFNYSYSDDMLGHWKNLIVYLTALPQIFGELIVLFMIIFARNSLKSLHTKMMKYKYVTVEKIRFCRKIVYKINCLILNLNDIFRVYFTILVFVSIIHIWGNISMAVHIFLQQEKNATIKRFLVSPVNYSLKLVLLAYFSSDIKQQVSIFTKLFHL